MRLLLDLLFPPRDDERIVRALPPDAFAALLAPQLISATRPATTALLPFAHEHVRPALHEAKYRGSPNAHALLAGALAEYLADAELDLTRTHLVPVPLSPKRLRERGFNQAEEVARRACGPLHIPILGDFLLRTRDTRSQTDLSRKERAENMRGAFGAARPADPSLTYIMFDDTITTGATLQAAIDALETAGAKHVVPIALAH